MIKKTLKRIPYLIVFYNAIIKYIETFQAQLIQRKYKKIVAKKKEKVLSGKSLKVVFFITQKQLWSGQSLYDEFSSGEYFDPQVVVFPDNENKVNSKAETILDNYNFFLGKGMNVRYGYDVGNDTYFPLISFDADIVFYDQPCPSISKSLLWHAASKDSLVCYIPYGYKIARFYQAHFNMFLQNSCWVVFSESEWHKKQFIKYGALKGRNVVTSGYPKLDEYNKDTDVAAETNVEKTIIWAPHWSIGNEGIRYSTFESNYVFFLEYAKSNPNVYWIFKPHQRLRSYLEETGFMTKNEVDEYYKQWEILPNTCFYNDSDYFDLFKKSSALITDCGSFLAEYLPTKNPILHLINNDSSGYNEVGEILINSYYKALTNADVDSFIEDVVINENDVLLEKRLSNLHLVRPNPNGAGRFIVNYFQEKLVGDN